MVRITYGGIKRRLAFDNHDLDEGFRLDMLVAYWVIRNSTFIVGLAGCRGVGLFHRSVGKGKSRVFMGEEARITAGRAAL